MITRAGPDPPAPAELAKETSRKRSRFGSPALTSENLLFLKQPLLAGMPMGVSPPRGPQPGVMASQADPVCPHAPKPQHPCPPHQLSSEHPPQQPAVHARGASALPRPSSCCNGRVKSWWLGLGENACELPCSQLTPALVLEQKPLCRHPLLLPLPAQHAELCTALWGAVGMGLWARVLGQRALMHLLALLCSSSAPRHRVPGQEILQPQPAL